MTVTADQVPSSVLLRDGSGATLRVTQPADHEALRRFFHELSPESHRRRFFTVSDPAETLIDAFCDSSNPKRKATVIALCPIDGELRPVAVGSYLGLGSAVAEAAFAVGDAFQANGLGTILLAKLAVMATANGFTRFVATVLPENQAMLEVFRDSGFAVRTKLDRGAVMVFLALPSPSAHVGAEDHQRRPHQAEREKPTNSADGDGP